MDSESAVQSSSAVSIFPVPKSNFSLISPKSVFVSQRDSLTPQALLYWARWIRDISVPLLERDSYARLSEEKLASFLVFFADLRHTPVTVDSLRNSCIHTALGHIVEQKMRWPDWIVQEAQELLQDWEKELGSLRSIHADLWGPGGRLEGVKELDEWQESILWKNNLRRGSPADGKVPFKDKPRGSDNVKDDEGSQGPYVVGHNGAAVGAWWIHPAAAHRDGLIHGSTHGITADKEGAYAILMTDGEEIKTGRYDVVKYKALQTDPGRFKLMRCVASYNPVRVLRTWRLRSPWAPPGGVRYDGLYQVIGYSIRLTTDDRRVDSWHYTFELKRLLDQRSFERTLQHPSAHEMDDWNNFEKLMGRNQGEGLMSLLFATYGSKSPVHAMTNSETNKKLSIASESAAPSPSIAASESTAERAMSLDSGYFTRRDSSDATGEGKLQEAEGVERKVERREERGGKREERKRERGERRGDSVGRRESRQSAKGDRE